MYMPVKTKRQYKHVKIIKLYLCKSRIESDSILSSSMVLKGMLFQYEA
jgi:hypothetical protein